MTTTRKPVIADGDTVQVQHISWEAFDKLRPDLRPQAENGNAGKKKVA